jgi:hypothetical protein
MGRLAAMCFTRRTPEETTTISGSPLAAPGRGRWSRPPAMRCSGTPRNTVQTCVKNSDTCRDRFRRRPTPCRERRPKTANPLSWRGFAGCDVPQGDGFHPLVPSVIDAALLRTRPRSVKKSDTRPGDLSHRSLRILNLTPGILDKPIVGYWEVPPKSLSDFFALCVSEQLG